MIELEVKDQSANIEINVETNSAGGTNDYEKLKNKPCIEGVELYKDTTLDSIGISEITNKAISNMFK